VGERKRQGQKKAGKQLELFSDHLPSTDGSGTAIGTGTGSIYLSVLSRNRALSEGLLERVVSVENLGSACQAVRKNGGKGGVDGMGTEELLPWLREHHGELTGSVLSESYRPQPVLGVRIPKASGGYRQLGIPTVTDRLLQQAIHQELNKLYDPLFSEHSYGFRPGRNAQQAVRTACGYVSEGNEWVVDIDLKSFFDHIHHERLMQRLSKGLGDKRLLRLIHHYLRSGLLMDGLEQPRVSGSPQGGPLSPLLSNIVLDELDKELEQRGHRFVRYADDCNIYVRSEKAGHRVLASVTRFIEQKLKLLVNHGKSGVRHCSQCRFLGYTLEAGGKARVSDKSVRQMKQKIKETTKRNRGVGFGQIIRELNAVFRGWASYFREASTWLPWSSLDNWVRRKLRCYRLKQCGRKYSVFKFLRNLGASERNGWNTAMYGRWWKKSGTAASQKAMGLRWFREQGLYSLVDLHLRFQC